MFTPAQALSAAARTQRSDLAQARLSIDQTVLLSGVSQADLLQLVEDGALKPNGSDAQSCSFDVVSVRNLQRAARVRENLALDRGGFAMALVVFNQLSTADLT